MITVVQLYVVIDALELKVDSPLVEAAGFLKAYFDTAEDRSTSMSSDFGFGDLTIIMAESHEIRSRFNSYCGIASKVFHSTTSVAAFDFLPLNPWIGRLGVSKFMTAETMFFHASPCCKDYSLTAERNLMCQIVIQLIGIFGYV
ncbi:hypothetical protein G6F64_011960 [Rhizopus arrhizus]|uniref:Uncharacterized protein n=1 Tax=Rhizopus oryzae TaxID=64495 RepID=A0A9P6WY41_RHIOR|nr:hypothetical protein G6F64_011960 [Rhizopus arrhizus]